jgi:hypothetical protein
MYQLDALDRKGCAPEAFDAEHLFSPRLDAPVILLDRVVQVLLTITTSCYPAANHQPSFRNRAISHT